MRLVWIGIVCLSLGLVPAAEAQRTMVNSGTPFNSAGHSFFENFSSSWGFSHAGNGSFRNFNFQFGGATPTVPFGGAQPGAGATGGFGGGGFGFNFSAAQGFSSNNVSQTPSVTTMNGYPGFFFDGAQSPFVIGAIPVVGSQDLGAANTVRGRLLRGEFHIDESGKLQAGPPPRSQMHGPLPQPAAKPQPQPAAKDKPQEEPPLIFKASPEEAQAQPARAGGGGANVEVASTAEESPQSLDQIRQQRFAIEQAEQRKAQAFWEQGRAAEAKGSHGAARIYYRMAANRAAGELKQQCLQRLKALSR